MSATRQQRWSRGALERVILHKGKADEAKFKTLCMKMPGLIKQAGLVQALVFMQSREKELGKGFVNDLAGVLGDQKLLATAQAAELPTYLALTNDASQVAIWFRRFAQIELSGDGDERDDA
jgi:CRISPR/Cas system CMR-associated protein Cmr5 small subunit